MAYELFIHKQEIEAIDIQGMSQLSMNDYKEYIREHLVELDRHEVLRSIPAGYPLAVTKEQLEMLISYLKELGTKMNNE